MHTTGRIYCASIDRECTWRRRSVPRWPGLPPCDATPIWAYPNPSPRADGSFVVVARTPWRASTPCGAHAMARWAVHQPASQPLTPASRHPSGTLHEHSGDAGRRPWVSSDPVDTLTSDAKVDSMARSAAVPRRRSPDARDADRAIELRRRAGLDRWPARCSRGPRDRLGSTRHAVEAPGAFGLIHGDLHYENVPVRSR